MRTPTATRAHYRSTDDGASWPSTVTIYPYSAAYSDTAVLDPAAAGGKAQRVGVLFEGNNNGEATGVNFAVVAFS